MCAQRVSPSLVGSVSISQGAVRASDRYVKEYRAHFACLLGEHTERILSLRNVGRNARGLVSGARLPRTTLAVHSLGSGCKVPTTVNLGRACHRGGVPWVPTLRLPRGFAASARSCLALNFWNRICNFTQSKGYGEIFIVNTSRKKTVVTYIHFPIETPGRKCPVPAQHSSRCLRSTFHVISKAQR